MVSLQIRIGLSRNQPERVEYPFGIIASLILGMPWKGITKQKSGTR